MKPNCLMLLPMKIAVSLLSLAMLSCSVVNKTSPRLSVKLDPYLETEQVPDDPDDPAIWIHPADHAQSIIVATNKVERPGGSLVVYDLNGKIIQTIGNLDRPNNVDIEQGIQLGEEKLDVAIVTEREARALRIYAIDAKTRTLRERAIVPVFDGEQGDHGAPMGLSIYKRADGTAFIIVGRKSGPTEGYLWQYRMLAGAKLELVRKFGKFSGKGEIEAIVADDALGYVYYADETTGIRKYHADPDVLQAEQQLSIFGQSGYSGDREGLAIYATSDRTGYLISTDQVQGKSHYFLYPREGGPAGPHNHPLLAILDGPADSTDGIDATSVPLTQALPLGILVAMNSTPRNFLVFRWPTLPENQPR
jgi:3-phytase